MTNASILIVTVFSLLGGILSLIGGVVLLRTRAHHIKLFTTYSVPFAAGALLGAVFLDLLREGLELSETDVVLLSVLGGIVGFFALERVTHWFHHHHEEDSTAKKSPLLIIVGDTLHNALDGVAIASSFLISVPTGIVTTIAVAAHEIPQEIGDFGVLLSKGLSKKKVLLANVVSSLATTVAAVAVFILGDADKLPLGVLLGISAGFLLYVALSDLIPTIHEKPSKKGSLDKQLLLLLAGIATVWLAVYFSHSYIEPEHDDHKSSPCVSYLDATGDKVLWEDCE
jgi:zinc and cadmium transporter